MTITQAGAEGKGGLEYVQQFLWPTVAFRDLYQEQGCTAEGGCEGLELHCIALLPGDYFKELLAQELAGRTQETQLSQHVQ